MEKISDFKQLRVWQKAIDLVTDIHQSTKHVAEGGVFYDIPHSTFDIR
jgi:hypothetical protein